MRSLRKRKEEMRILTLALLIVLNMSIIIPGQSPVGADTAQAPPDPAEIFALCIGIGDYPCSSPERCAPKLDWADSDAKTCYDYFTEYLQVPREHCKIVKDHNATKENIEYALKDIKDDVNESDASRVYIFYSGHGSCSSPIITYDYKEISVENIWSLVNTFL